MFDFISLVYLVPLFPALSFAAIVLFLNSKQKLSSTVAIAMIALSWLLSWGIVSQVLGAVMDGHGHGFEAREIVVGWAPTGTTVFNIGFMVDGFTAAMLFMVPFVCTLIFIYAQGYMNPPDLGMDKRYSRFFAYVSLFAAGMLLLVVSNNLFTLFVSWEIMGLCSYLLIGFWYEKQSAVNASKKAFLTTRVGDVLLFAGMLFLFSQTGTLTFSEIFSAHVLEELAHAQVNGVAIAPVIALLVFGGAVGKSAQFPLHVWLPDAMEGPTPVSALIHAATMVAAGVYLIARMMPVFAISGLEGSTPLMVVGLIGGFTALFASTIAVAQNDIKRVLAYSTVSQLGYMVMALGVGGFVAAVFHLLTHAFFKALLFMGSGSVIIGIERGHHAAEHGHDAHAAGHDDHGHEAPASHAFDPNDMMHYGGLLSKMPQTGWTFIIGALALSGIFPLAGFWSKDEILAHAFHGGIQHGEWLPALIYVIGTFSAFLTAFYTGRQLGLTFFGKPRHAASEMAKESPLSMTFPLMALAAFTLVLGAMNLPENVMPGMDILHKLIGGVFEKTEIEGVAEWEATGFNLTVAAISSVAAILGLVLGISMYRKHPAGAPDPLERMPGYHFLKNKWYVDEFYRKTVVGWTYALADFSWRFDRNVVDGMVNTVGEAGRQMAFDLRDAIDTYVIEGVVNGAGRLAMWGGQSLRRIQTGKVQDYLSVAVIGLVILASYRLVGGNWETMLAGAVIFGFVGVGAYVFSRASK